MQAATAPPREPRRDDREAVVQARMAGLQLAMLDLLGAPGNAVNAAIATLVNAAIASQAGAD